MKALRLLAALLLALVAAPAAHAQIVFAKTVATCGTPGNTPVAGNSYPLTMNLTGVLCTSAAGGGGGGAITSPVDGNGNVKTVLYDATGAPVSYSDPANSNTADVNGATVDVGQGAPGAGTQRVATASSANFTPATASCASTATLFAASRSSRAEVTIENSGTTAVYLGGSGVTTATGVLLPGVLGASITLQTTAAIYCIVASSTQAVTGYELY